MYASRRAQAHMPIGQRCARTACRQRPGAARTKRAGKVRATRIAFWSQDDAD
jgi:hypothetical protein